MINKPKFNLGSKDRLTELQNFQEECQMLFEGPYKEDTTARKASPVLNWLGHQGAMSLQES